MQGGTKAELNIAKLLAQARSRDRDEPAGAAGGREGAIVAAVREHVWPLIADGRVRPIVHARLPIAEAAAAHRVLEASEHVGKVLLTTGLSAGRARRAATRGGRDVGPTRGGRARRRVARA